MLHMAQPQRSARIGSSLPGRWWLLGVALWWMSSTVAQAAGGAVHRPVSPDQLVHHAYHAYLHRLAYPNGSIQDWANAERAGQPWPAFGALPPFNNPVLDPREPSSVYESPGL